ncbi:MAG TPA: transglutaminase domain-containing protein [Pirellulaceae bacterium]|nr:transglutaminase domain-containing protein [Pirellulaceae bacterium]HMO92361.1 transglutaminase domain-containing protein [Pirellulaceae bacterium]HMP71309.1 transglutaminase domain-containing protein [Pirellulaceae bacterium]
MLNKLFKINVNGFSLLLAVIAWMLVFMWRGAYQFQWNFAVYLQPLGSLGLAAGLFFSTRRITEVRRVDFWLLPFGLAGLVLPFGIGLVERNLDLGTPWEVLSMVVFANWTLLLAVLSRHERYQNLTAIFAGTSTFVVISMIEGWRFSLLGGAYAIVLLWWSMTRYWGKLEQKFADDQVSKASIRSFVFLVSIAGMVFLGGLLVTLASTGALSWRGFSWFSGGNVYSDDFAQDGVGQGDGIRAATNNPITFGPVDSQIFLESKQPSLYDITSDVYGDPQKVRRSTRAVGIQAELMQHAHERVAVSQQASGEFSVARKPRNQRATTAKDRLSLALFHFKGQAPVWLGMETYNHFDDGCWVQQDQVAITKGNVARRKSGGNQVVYRNVSVETQSGKPWMKVRHQLNSSFWGGWEYAAVKVINLQSLRIPTPPSLEQFHIDRIDREDFFRIGSDEIPQLNHGGSQIPADTVIHLVSARTNLYQALVSPQSLREQLNNRAFALADYLNTDAVSESIKSLASNCAEGLQSDWERVEAIVSHLRDNYQHDSDALLPEGETDAARFLVEQGAGTDYMFATAAALMIRHLGIPTRLVKGFWVDPKNFDRRTGHTSVLGKNVHVWLEVSLDGMHWTPIEPTPGFPQPRYHLSMQQRIALAYFRTCRWVAAHPLTAGLLILLCGMLTWNYKWLLQGYHTLMWQLGTRFNPQTVARQSAKLIDRRAKLAGFPRAAGVSPARFSRSLSQLLTKDEDEETTNCVQQYTTALNCELYHPRSMLLGRAADQSTIQACRSVVARFGFSNLRRLRKTLGSINYV